MVYNRIRIYTCVLVFISIAVLIRTFGRQPYENKSEPYRKIYSVRDYPHSLSNGNEQQSLFSNGKTIVYRYNGQTLDRLYDFCTWTLPTDCASLKTLGGPMWIFIHDVDEDPVLSAVVKKKGKRDPGLVEIIINELKKYPDAGFFDFGSHIGVYALSIAHTLGRKAIAIDPMIDNTIRLCKSIQLNNLTDNVMIVFNPILNDHSRVTFKVPKHHIGGTTVLKSPGSKEWSCDDTESFSVMMDDIIPIVPFKTAVMKLDVEKSEYFAIQGGLKFFQEIDVRSILMEWYNIVRTPHAGPLVDLMKRLNYVPYLPFVNGEHKRLEYDDYLLWTKQRAALDVLWIKES